MKIVDNLVSKFQTGFDVRPGDFATEPIGAGHLHDSFCVTHKPKNLKYILQKLNPVFDLQAINANLKLLEQAQIKSLRFFPSYWQPVRYLNVLNSQDKIYFDPKGRAWKVMEYVPGKIKIFDNFNQVPEKEKPKVAFSLGEAIAIFDKTLTTIPSGLWREPLPNFHNTLYHYNYLFSILNGKKVTLSLSRRKANKVCLDSDFFTNNIKRIDSLVDGIRVRKNLISCLDGLGDSVVHGDPKLNNAVFAKDQEGSWRCISLIDLDTVQVGNFLDDLGDALRSAGNPSGEEPASLSDVRIDKLVVENLIKGYFAKVKFFYGQKKMNKIRKYVYKAYAKFLYELGIRFLADSLVGNCYFKLKEGQPRDLNLYRAEVQLKTLDILESTC